MSYVQRFRLNSAGRLGFSEAGVLAACDSAGELAARGPDFGGAWVPVFSSAAARKASEVHWIAGLGETGVYCVVCPATAPYPQVNQCYASLPSLHPSRVGRLAVASHGVTTDGTNA